MIRRSVALVCVIIATLTLSSCSTFRNQSAVATVNGTELTRGDLRTMMEDATIKKLTGGSNASGQTDAKVGGQIIGAWAALTAFDGRGLLNTADPAVATALTTSYPTWKTSPAVVQQFLLRFGAFQAAQSAGTTTRAAVSAAIRAAHIHVDSRYGYWDPARVSVIAFG